MENGNTQTADLESVLSKKEQELNELYCDMGKSLLEMAENEQRVANRLVDEIIALRKKLVRARKSVQCAECLAYNAADSNYCSRCGSRLAGDGTGRCTDSEPDNEEAGAI